MLEIRRTSERLKEAGYCEASERINTLLVNLGSEGKIPESLTGLNKSNLADNANKLCGSTLSGDVTLRSLLNWNVEKGRFDDNFYPPVNWVSFMRNLPDIESGQIHRALRRVIIRFGIFFERDFVVRPPTLLDLRSKTVEQLDALYGVGGYSAYLVHKIFEVDLEKDK